MVQTAQVPPAPPPAAGPARGGGRAARLGAALILVGFLAGLGLVVYGFADREAAQPPVAIDGSARVTALEEGAAFAIYRVGEVDTDPCRVTTANGTAVSVSRAPGSTITVMGVRYQARWTFEAMRAGTLTIDCPEAAMLYVGPRQPGGRNVVAIVAGFILGIGLIVGGLIVALVGTVVTSGGGRRGPPS